AIGGPAAGQWAGVNADSGNLRVDGYSQIELLVPYATSLHVKAEISAKDGTKEKTDWSRLLTIIGKSGYRGYAGLEYEGTNEAEIPRLAAELRMAVRKL